MNGGKQSAAIYDEINPFKFVLEIDPVDMLSLDPLTNCTSENGQSSH